MEGNSVYEQKMTSDMED